MFKYCQFEKTTKPATLIVVHLIDENFIKICLLWFLVYQSFIIFYLRSLFYCEKAAISIWHQSRFFYFIEMLLHVSKIKSIRSNSIQFKLRKMILNLVRYQMEGGLKVYPPLPRNCFQKIEFLIKVLYFEG